MIEADQRRRDRDPHPRRAGCTCACPPGADGGSKLRLRGKGIPAAGGKPEGDLIVVLRIKTPKKLEEEQREALAGLLPDDGDELRSEKLG